jgi:hypothetical protein
MARKQADWKDAEWTKAGDILDVNKLFINYLNLKYEYGDEDPRTIEAFENLENARKKNGKK